MSSDNEAKKLTDMSEAAFPEFSLSAAKKTTYEDVS